MAHFMKHLGRFKKVLECKVITKMYQNGLTDQSPQSGGDILIEMAKKAPKVAYDEDTKLLIEFLIQIFGDEPMCHLI